MSHSSRFNQLTRLNQIVRYCQQHNLSTAEGLEQLIERSQRLWTQSRSRRDALKFGGSALLGAATGIGLAHGRRAIAAAKPMDARVAIIGAGLAGLACAYELKKKGITATLYEASDRVGGRCYSLSGLFPGQVAERGGEFIDNLHKTMLGYAQEFKLPLEDVSKPPGEIVYYINNQRYRESAVIDEYRNFVAAMQADLRSLSSQPTAENFTPRDRQLDYTTLQSYLDSRNAGRLIKAVIKAAYIGEYGREIDEQSCLSFLLFIHADKRSKFRPFGVFSDERYHLVNGNQQIVDGLRSRLPNQIQLGKQLVSARKNSAGQVELTFSDRSSQLCDAVIFATPFSTLRQVDLTGLQLPVEKQRAIANLVYGTNTKLMVGLTGRPWIAQGSNGSSYADLPFVQGTWETNPMNAAANRAVLTNYTGGRLGASLNPNQVQQAAQNFLGDVNHVFPGTAAVARTSGNRVVAHLEHWPSNPWTRGSYTCNHPGYFTTIADLEGKPIGNLFFAGEHTSSFYEWQGFMEGAAISGIRAAQQLLAYFKVGSL
jgi:monoamine oxidase